MESGARKSVILISLFLMGTLSLGVSLLPEIARATTLHVGGAGPGNYTTIQSAVDNASAGSVVYIFAGTYLENVIVDRPISIIGEDKGTTIIDGNASGDVMRITSDWVNVTGVKVANGGISGFKLEYVQYCRIWDNLVQGNDIGIHVYYSDDNTIEDNNASLNNYFGISLFVAYRNAISNNTVSNNLLTGIGLSASVSNTVADNSIYLNEYGVVLTNSHFNTVLNNTFYDNDKGLRLVTVSQNNTVYHNNFMDNTEQALDEVGWNDWDNGYPSGGNYWSDYSGVDDMSGVDQNQPGSDGIGDVRYDVPGGMSQDRYPLMIPFVPTAPTAPSAPRNLEATAGQEQLTLTWQTPTQDGGSAITNYVIYRGTSSGGETFLTEVGYTLEHTDTGLTDGQTYYYTVSAKNAVGEGPMSNEASATPTAPPNQIPECAIYAPPPGGETVSGLYNITGTASDPDGTVESVEVRIDDEAWMQATGTTSWTHEWDTTEASDGSHMIHARSYDGTNYSHGVSVGVIVDNAGEPLPGDDEGVFSQAWFWLAILVAIVVIIIVLVALRRRGGPETALLEAEEAE